MSIPPSHIYNIPAGVPFAKALAAQILLETKNDPALLAAYRIFLPSRRACRNLREAFLVETAGRPLLLPHMQSLGDVDEEELIFADLPELLNIPPALPPMKRRFLLAKLIESRPDYHGKPDQALALAIALGQLMDHIYTENLNIKDLDKLVPDEFASHWQITLDFLKIISEYWPKILSEHGAIDEADRRNRLTLALANHLEKAQPAAPIIAAGSTGSIPATARLLEVIAGLPQGRLVLPGLDETIDDESWESLEDHHPQFGLKNLLSKLKIDRNSVQTWHMAHQERPINQSRRLLATEIMRPAATTQQWQNLADNTDKRNKLEAAFNHLDLIECEHDHQEAQTIAILLREILEDPNKTAVLITPDRNLARRVRASMRRWNIELDDSAGEPLSNTPTGRFLKASLEALISDFSPVALLSLLKQPHLKNFASKETLHHLDIALRGPKPPNGLDGIKQRLHTDPKSLALIEKLQKLAPSPQQTASLKKHIAAHLKFAENLTGTDLWQNEGGEAAAAFFAELLSHADLITTLTPAQYLAIIDTLMQTITVRPAYGTHPRLHILGQLEARMINADRVILAGLNEGIWPPDPGHDPWMSRPMRTKFGLPSPERSIGLAAHDFVQGFCAPEVILTRSKRSAGTPTIPARWLQRLNAILDVIHIKEFRANKNPALLWAKSMDQNPSQNGRTEPIARPAPTPPAPSRPTQLPVTKIETWLKDPYAIYARYILGLKKLNTLEELPDTAFKGGVLHTILERFVAQHQNTCIKTNWGNLYDKIHEDAKSVLQETETDPALWQFWWPRFARLASWFLDHQSQWQMTYSPLQLEAKGSIQIGNFTLTGVADRIDQNKSNGAAIIDYKSAGSYTQKSIANGQNPQLALEAMMLAAGGFENTPALEPETLVYLVLNGTGDGGKAITYDKDIPELIENTRTSLSRLITVFADETTPYHSIPNPANAPRFSDYTHLARIGEWGVVGDDEPLEDAA